MILDVIKYFKSTLPPNSVILTSYGMLKPPMQGLTNTCVAHSLCACQEYLMSQKTGIETVPKLSPWFLHSLSARLENEYQPPCNITQYQIKLSTALEVMQQYGVCEDNQFAFNDLSSEQFNILSILSARQHRIQGYQELYNSQQLIEVLHVHHRPVVTLLPTLLIPCLAHSEINLQHMVTQNYAKDNLHCILIIGHVPKSQSSDTPELYVVMNSFGDIWGYNGLSIIPSESLFKNASAFYTLF